MRADCGSCSDFFVDYDPDRRPDSTLSSLPLRRCAGRWLWRTLTLHSRVSSRSTVALCVCVSVCVASCLRVCVCCTVGVAGPRSRWDPVSQCGSSELN